MWPFNAKKPKPNKKSKRYAAAKGGRLNYGWGQSSKSANAELRGKLKVIRERSRELERDNDLARRFLNMVEDNMIGAHGVRLQCDVKKANGEADLSANKRIEDSWKEWGNSGLCTMARGESFKDIERMGARSQARDGEALAIEVTGPEAGNKWNYALHMLESDHIDDEYFRDLGNGNQIYMGVETNKWGSPIAYHLLTSHPGNDSYQYKGRKYDRITADKIIHPFKKNRAGQLRGEPWMVSVMQRLRMLGAYEEAELVAARVSASKMGFYINKDGGEVSDDLADGVDENGELIMDAEAGVFQILDGDYDFKAFDPQHPNSAFKDFGRALRQSSAAGLNVAHHSLSGDLEGVNYSTARVALLDERDGWRSRQDSFIFQFHRRIFPTWLSLGLLTDAIPLPSGEDKYKKFNQATWQPRGWQWVDPLKEVQAAILAINNALTSRSDTLGERGKDFQEVLEALKNEVSLAENIGFPLPTNEVKNAENTDENKED